MAVPASTPVADLLRSGAMARAFTLTAFAVILARFAIEHTAGLTTYLWMAITLSCVAVAILVARRRVVSPLRLTSPYVVSFVGWAALSIFWAYDQSYSLVAVASLSMIALTGAVIGTTNDTLDVISALATVCRWLLGASAVLELLSGIFLNVPIPFLGIQGNIASLGPIQGIFGTRNALGFVAIMALITFVIEWRARITSEAVSLLSAVLAAVLALLTGSPIVLVIAVVVVVAAVVLAMVRHTRRPYRSTVQFTLGGLVIAGLALAYLLREQLFTLIGADSDIDTRYALWLKVLEYVRFHPFTGWGWVGPWVGDTLPFSAINIENGHPNTSALNAFFDVLLQVGWVGFILFAALGGVAFVHAWIEASDAPASFYAWTPLALSALLADSLFESLTLSSFGWLLLVVCATRADPRERWSDLRGRLWPIGRLR